MSQTKSNQQPTILVVDDTEINRDILGEFLGREGYHVLFSEDGASAKAQALQNKPDLILMDVNMPGETGFDVIKFLKSESRTASIPVIFITGMSNIKSKLVGFDLGAVDYITKPFHPREVLARVRIHLKLGHAANQSVENQTKKLRELQDVQRSMLISPNDLTSANFGVFYESMHEAGGDFYDVVQISQDIFGYFIADFAGHDIKSSYLTASLKGLLLQNTLPIFHPGETMKMMNDVLHKILSPSDFLTACYMRLNRLKEELIVVNAGHTPPLYAPKDEAPQFLDLEGDVLGAFNDVVFGEQTIKVSEGDRIYLYSDGLVESHRKGVLWTAGLDRLKTIIIDAQDTPIEETPQKVVSSLFNKETKREDDTVLLCFQF